jgi:hypothetical protein
MLDYFKNAVLNRNRYRTHSQAMIVSCFFNPQNNPYRLLAFQKFYRSIYHLNYRIIECTIGNSAPQLPHEPNIIQVNSDSLLWHKETLLNKLISELPEKYKYVFWLDADILFTNYNWLVDSVEKLQAGANIIQPFEYCIHLEKNQLIPNASDPLLNLATAGKTNKELDGKKKLWRSFSANYVADERISADHQYDVHGHVGFAWGARREVLEKCPLFDRALIGGGDHIIAHAAAGQIPHPCITKGFGDNIDEVENWSNEFYDAVRGKIAYTHGYLHHIWHGNIADRQYLKRVREFTDKTVQIKERDENGLHIAKGRDKYVRRYYQEREVAYDESYTDYGSLDVGFYEDMGYLIGDMVQLFGQSQIYNDPDPGAFDTNQTNEFTPLDQGGAGVTDEGQHVITNEQLQGATVSGPDDLATAIYHAAQDIPAPEPVVDTSENYS